VSENVPAYLLIGYPNVSRGPGFLGAKHGYIYLVDTESGPAGFTPPEDIDPARAASRQKLLAPLQGRTAAESAVCDYEVAQREALRLAGPGFMRHFKIAEEPAALRQRYGGEFGQRCLLARRLVQAGVRFIEVSHNLNFINGAGWDTHNAGQLNQHVLIRELDTALSALITDLPSVGRASHSRPPTSAGAYRPIRGSVGTGRWHVRCFTAGDGAAVGHDPHPFHLARRSGTVAWKIHAPGAGPVEHQSLALRFNGQFSEFTRSREQAKAHFADCLRAVEQGRYMVRAANTGISGAVDPYGRVLARSTLFEASSASRTIGVRLTSSPSPRPASWRTPAWTWTPSRRARRSERGGP
jgi:hypothetical protein